MRILFLLLTCFTIQFSFGQNDSINELLIFEVKASNYAEASRLILEEEANPNYLDTIIIETGGSNPTIKMPQGGGIIGALVGILTLPFQAIGVALSSLLPSDRGSYYEIRSVLELAINGKDNAKRMAFIELLLKNGADPNQNGTAFNYPLNLAVVKNDEKLIDLLLEYGADVKGASAHQSLLLQSVSLNNEALAIKFLEKGDDPLVVNKWDNSALASAVNKKMYDFVALCVSKNVDVSKQLEANSSPYYEAVLNQDEKMTLILEESATFQSDTKELIDEIQQTPYHYWATHDIEVDLDYLDQLNAKHPTLLLLQNGFEETALDVAVYSKVESQDYLKWLLSHDFSLKEENRIKLLSSKDREILEKIIKEDESHILMQLDFDAAIFRGEIDSLDIFIAKGAMANGAHLTQAVQNLDFPISKYILQLGISPNDTIDEDYYRAKTVFIDFANSYLETSTYSQNVREREKMLLLLLQYGADVHEEEVIENAQAANTFLLIRHLMDYGLTAEECFLVEKWYEDDLHVYIEDYDLQWQLANKQVPIYKNGEFEINGELFQNAYASQLGLSRVKKEGSWYILSEEGNIISEDFDTIYMYQYRYKNQEDQIAMIVDDGKYNYIDKEGDKIFPIDFDDAIPFENVYGENRNLFTTVSVNNLKGLIRDNGTLATKIKYQEVSDSPVYWSDKVEVVTVKGKIKHTKIKTFDKSLLLNLN